MFDYTQIMIPNVLDLDPAAVLAAAEELTLEQRRQAVEDIRLVLQWADLHADDPGEGRAPGADQLVEFGGEGTPAVRELCWAELAIARHSGLVATKRLAADALDLRHRLPLVWQAVQDLRLPAWVARKIASMSRALGKDAIVLVDVAAAAAVDQAPGRVLAITEAKVIEADIEAHRARLAADAAEVGVRLSHARPGDALDLLDGQPATRRLTLKLPTGTALGFDATVAEVADALHDQLRELERDQITRGELEAKAVELLSNPHAAAAFLDVVHDPTKLGESAFDLPKQKKRPATLYIHLSELVLGGMVDGVARVESIGPMLLEQVTDLLQHRDVTVQPVIDLNQTHSVSGYEHPTVVKHRSVLRMLGDVFPHSTNVGYRRLDHDHATPYVPPDRGGAPGQTGDHNDAPLTRIHHRVKTHEPGYQLRQLALDAYRWVTPHGLGRLVTPSGTRRFQPIQGPGGIVGEIHYPARGPTPQT
jgi:hypothetical protein